MKLEVEDGAQVLVIRVDAARIDAAAAIQFKDRMREAFACPAPRVVLDLSRVDFMDSSGLGAVVAAMKLIAPGRRLELAGLSPTVDKVFRLTRMDRVFTIHASVAQAMDLRHAG